MKPTERRAIWQRHLDAWRVSGLSLSAYCADQQLSRESMRRWRQRLASRSIGDTDAVSAKPQVAAALVPISVRDCTATAPIANSGVIEIRLQHGRSIVIDAAVDETSLARLIGVVERAP